MTRPLHLTQADIQGLDPIQREMIERLVKEINDTWELEQITIPKAEAVLSRVLDVIGRFHEHNRRMVTRIK